MRGEFRVVFGGDVWIEEEKGGGGSEGGCEF